MAASVLRQWVSRWTRSTWTGEVVVRFLFGDGVEFVGGADSGGQVDPIDLDRWRLFGDEGQHDQLKETGNDNGWWMMSW